MKKSATAFLIVILLLLPICFVNISLAKNTTEYEVPDYVEIGDLLYLDYTSKIIQLEKYGTMKGHVAIYIGDNNFVHACKDSGVEIKDYEYFLINYEKHVFGYVITNDSSKKTDAALWAQSKIGKKYQNIPCISKKGSNDRWYDTELVWAAYYSQGIDIDENGWDAPVLVNIQEIIDDLDTETYIVYPVPSYVKRGDIVFMDIKNEDTYWAIPGPSNDHAAIYLGHDYRDGSYFIHAGGQGVKNTTFDLYNFAFKNFTFYYVNNADDKQVEGAIQWAVDQIGTEYQCFFPDLNPHYWYRGMFDLGEKCADPNDESVKTADRFYCMELVWAAYYNQGIDIDQNGWEKVKPVPNDNVPKFFRNMWELFGWAFAYVECNDVKYSENTTQRLPVI